jgi:hypothetical protein
VCGPTACDTVSARDKIANQTAEGSAKFSIEK